jgi:hypothetical protein
MTIEARPFVYALFPSLTRFLLAEQDEPAPTAKRPAELVALMDARWVKATALDPPKWASPRGWMLVVHEFARVVHEVRPTRLVADSWAKLGLDVTYAIHRYHVAPIRGEAARDAARFGWTGPVRLLEALLDAYSQAVG